MKIILPFLTALLILIYSCGKDSGIVNPPGSNEYQKIQTVEKNNVKFEIYSATSNKFIYGYNDIGFKVFLNGTEKNTGYVNMKATMYHGIGGPSHSTPSDDRYIYNSEKQMFTGYISFIMIDTAAFWAAKYDYNGEASIDSADLSLFGSDNQTILWDNQNTQKFYIITLIKPNSCKVGMNDYHMLLHESPDMNRYYEIDNAEVFLRPWMPAMGHGSSNNINPSSVGNGRYEGKVNFTMSGSWEISDSIKINDTWLTRTPLPKFTFTVN